MDIVCNKDKNDLENFEKKDSFELTSDGIVKQEKVVFLYNRNDLDDEKPMIVFVGQTSSGLSTKRFVVQNIENQKQLKATEKELGNDLWALQYFVSDLPLISIVYQWVEYKNVKTFKLIIFFKDQWIIRWCLTEEMTLKQEEV